MWLENLEPGESWMGVWKALFRCDQCNGLISDHVCPLCGYGHKTREVEFKNADGAIVKIPQLTVKGALEWSTYSFITLIQREWERPIIEEEAAVIYKNVPQKLMIVVLFWTLFENLMERFFTDALKSTPKNIAADLLRRYSGIGARLDRLYKIVFNVTFREDLELIGYEHLYKHLKILQDKRNDFMHGNHEAINESLINETVKHFQDVQYVWIQLYNKRCRLVRINGQAATIA
jgi:hypothetical protein